MNRNLKMNQERNKTLYFLLLKLVKQFWKMCTSQIPCKPRIIFIIRPEYIYRNCKVLMRESSIFTCAIGVDFIILHLLILTYEWDCIFFDVRVDFISLFIVNVQCTQIALSQHFIKRRRIKISIAMETEGTQFRTFTQLS